jgi:hypothetical protein
MYKKITNGVKHVINDVECWTPPVGHVYNRITGKVEKREILKLSVKKSDQMWFRTPLPENYNRMRDDELRKKEIDPSFYDSKLEGFRQQEWDRRLNGVWFMNNGQATYITGLHYFYLNWWRIDIGYPGYRDPDRKFFYFLQAAIENPNCLGVVELTKRRQGKTFRSGVFLYDLPSRSKNKYAGIQSKTADDAKKNVFGKAVINPFKHLPDFFKPVFDQAKGATPTSELRFYQTTKRGRVARDQSSQPELESWIDWRNSLLYAYDGTKLHRYVSDEAGKLEDVDIWERHMIVRFCMEQDGEFIGKALYTTTVEEMASGGDAFKKLWKYSNQNEKGETGRTISGMWRYFTPSYETLYFDQYGIPEEQRSKDYYMSERHALRNDSKALASYIRKNPFSPEEAFRSDGDSCMFDSMKLNDQLEMLEWSKAKAEIGNLIWKNPDKKDEVVFVPDKNGRFRVLEHPIVKNDIGINGTKVMPSQKSMYVAGIDPYDLDQTVDNRGSLGAAYVFKKFDAFSEVSFCPVAEYLYRPAMAKMFYEDMIKLVHYFGCQALIERNRVNCIQYFCEVGYDAFIMKVLGKMGLHASDRTNRQLAEFIEEYVYNHCENIYFDRLIRDLLEFRVEKTTKYDAAMAFGYALMADRNTIYKRKEIKTSVSKLFKRHKISHH